MKQGIVKLICATYLAILAGASDDEPHFILALERGETSAWSGVA